MSEISEEKKNIIMSEELVQRMGRTKKRIIIELYRDKRLSKMLGVGLDYLPKSRIIIFSHFKFNCRFLKKRVLS